MSGGPALGLIHRFEPAREPGAPTLLLLHGTGADENDLLPLGRALADRAALLSPRGPVSERGAPRWFRRHAEGVFDTDDLIARTHQLAAFVAAAADRYALDASTMLAVGFSNGANIAAAMLLLRPEVLRGAVLFSPMVPLDDPAPVDLSGVGVFIGAGRADPIAPPAHAEALARLLTDRDASVELRWHPGGHQITQDSLTTAAGWLGKLRARSPPTTCPEALPHPEDGAYQDPTVSATLPRMGRLRRGETPASGMSPNWTSCRWATASRR